MGGKTSQNQSQTSTTVLPGAQQGNVDLLMQGAKDLYSGGGPSFFPGQTYAPTTGQQLTARTGMENYAGGAGSDFVNQYLGGEKFFLNPQNIFNPSNIPGFNAATEGVTKGVTRNLMENIIPQIRGGSIATGSLGGSRQGISEGLAIRGANQTLADTLAGMNMNAYNSGLGMYNSAAGRAPTSYGMGLMPSSTLSSVGQEYQSDTQKAIDEAMQKYNFNQMKPLLNLQTLQALTGTAGQYGGTTSSTGTTSQSGGNSWLPAIGSGLMFASLL